uniref:Uncharacterized protein n=1 Tax=Eubacterium plexicaudatum ASF492 TaxID=1235802 RepID=N2AL27_9FIRM
MVKYIRIVRATPHNRATEVKTGSTPKAAITQGKEREYCKKERRERKSNCYRDSSADPQEDTPMQKEGKTVGDYK